MYNDMLMPFVVSLGMWLFLHRLHGSVQVIFHGLMFILSFVHVHRLIKLMIYNYTFSMYWAGLLHQTLHSYTCINIHVQSIFIVLFKFVELLILYGNDLF